jgi:hypothetical protein
VVLADTSGRSCVDSHPSLGTGTVVLHAPSGKIDKDRLAHEGAHMALGHGDEYREVGKPIERVREDDWSLLGNHSEFGRFALLHERHFGFVPAFLNHILPGCMTRLNELSRPTRLDWEFTARGGYSVLGGSRGTYLSLGLEAGIPLSRQREWELRVGPHLTMLANLEAPNRSAFLLGTRVGLEHTFTPSSGGLRVGAFGEVGGGLFQTPQLGEYKRDLYGEAGVTAGYAFGARRSSISLVGEAAAGRRFDTADPATRKWFQLGIGVVVGF